MLFEQVDQNLVDAFGTGLPVYDFVPQNIATKNAFALLSSVVEERGQALVSVRVEDNKTGKRVWSERKCVSTDLSQISNSVGLLSLAFGISSAVLETARDFDQYGENPNWDATVLRARAIPNMFSFDPAQLRVAEELLRAAELRSPSPITKAWLSLLYQFILAERIDDDNSSIAEKSSTYLRLAIEQAPNNANICAIASIVSQLLGGNFEEGMALARHAIALNRGNALAHVGCAISLMREGDGKAAQNAIFEAHSIAERTPFLNWIEMFISLASITCKDFELARKSAESALCRSPGFRPPMRHLYALHLRDGNKGLAAQVVRKLRKVEPDFSLSMIRRNNEYPAKTLRGSQLVELKDI